VPPHPKLPAKECFSADCPEGNRSMKHVSTRSQRMPGIGIDAIEYVALFRCEKCHATDEEVFEPSS
jgi:hypothetical protein